MQNREIINRQNGETLYSGHFKSFKACIEAAIRDNVNLSGAALAYKNLCQANLDDGVFDHADFTGSNLIGANLSEASLNHAVFTDCSLESACLAFSSLQGCEFTGARFGGTHIEGALIDDARFSGHSWLHLDFINSESMAGCLYTDESGATVQFSVPPLLLHGLPQSLAVIGDMIKIGTQLHPPASIYKLDDPLLHHYRDLLHGFASTKKLAVTGLPEAA